MLSSVEEMIISAIDVGFIYVQLATPTLPANSPKCIY